MSSHTTTRAAAVILALALLATLGLVPGSASAQAPTPRQAVTIDGVVEVAGSPLGSASVELLATGRAGEEPRLLAAAQAGVDGAFSVAFDEVIGSETALYLVARAPDGGGTDPRLVLTSVLGSEAANAVVINERTTTASAFAMARFIVDGRISGAHPGIRNAAGMARNLADPITGATSTVLTTAPNGDETETLRTFNSLNNMVAACAADSAVCDTFVALATTPDGQTPADTLGALRNIARYPWHNAEALFTQVASAPPALDQPARVAHPDGWMLAVRFVGDGQSLDGPGNAAVDHEGNLWMANNYAFAPDATTPSCASQVLPVLDPSGQYVPGAPFTGGGLSGPGFGVTIDPFGDVWLGNYGFAGVGCEDPPPHNSVSRFRLDGTAVSPPEGYVVGGIDWPQATVSDDVGNIWLANCGNDSVTLIPEGNPAAARQITDLGIDKPFAIAVTSNGNVFVTGSQSSTIAVIARDGTPLPNSPIAGDFLDRPMAIVADSSDHLWVANSAGVDLPCPEFERGDGPIGSLLLLDPQGNPVGNPFNGGGLTVPWGLAVDGNDNVWVANFTGRRLSQFCGTSVTDCRPGSVAGDAISPDVTGYGHDGLTRNTAPIIDQSGNVWVTNNWKDVPIQANPGGYEMVAFVGAAEPIEVAAPRERPAPPGPQPSPSPRPSPSPTTRLGAAPAIPLTVTPRFTG